MIAKSWEEIQEKFNEIMDTFDFYSVAKQIVHQDQSWVHDLKESHNIDVNEPRELIPHLRKHARELFYSDYFTISYEKEEGSIGSGSFYWKYYLDDTVNIHLSLSYVGEESEA